MKDDETKIGKRLISDPYLSAYLFLNLKIKPKPVIDNSGRVSFEFTETEELERTIESFYKDALVSAFTFTGGIKAVKSIIFMMKTKVK